MRTIWRYVIPVNDEWHTVEEAGDPLYVDCRDPRFVEFWAFHEPGAPSRQYAVYGTGHPIEDSGAQYVGTAIDPGRRLVWHLLTK